MNNNSANLLIEEDELESSDQIALYTEIIRILEKDIDDAKSRSSQEGWNTWGILGAIAAAVFVLLGQTKDLLEIPSETVTITLTFIILFQFFLAAYNFLTNGKNLAKEKRLIDSKQVFKNRRFLLFLRLTTLTVVSIFIFSADYPIWLKATSVTLIFIPILYILLTIFVSSYTKIPIGNNPKYQRVGSVFGFIFLLLYLIAVILLGNQLKFPIGQSLTAAYVIGLSLSSIVVLSEVLLTTSTQTEPINELQDIKDDIIFRRTNLNEALYRYQIIKEGRSLSDEMQEDFNKIMAYLHREEEIYIEQKKILKKLSELLPMKNDSGEVIKDKGEQSSIYLKSFETYTREMNGLISLVTSELNQFNTKLKKAADASGDYETQDLINRLLNQKLNELVAKEGEIIADRNNLIEHSNKLELQSFNSKEE